MWPWDELGLAPTGDERLIRKAYAERARHTRPDDDSDAFIRLRAAYEAALAAAARLAPDADDKVVRLDGFRDRPPPKPEPRPAVQAPPEFDRAAPAIEPVGEPAARPPVTPRNARVRIERVGANDPVDPPKPPPPPAAPKPRVRIERVAPAEDQPAPPSPPPVRSRLRIERLDPAPSDGSKCPPGKS